MERKGRDELMSYFEDFKKQSDINGFSISSIHSGPDGSGGDASKHTDYIFWLGFEPNKRVIGFKAFIEDIKLSISKDGEWKVKKDNPYPAYTPLGGRAGYEVTLNIPAHSVAEARNNMAKIAELQRMIVPHRDIPVFEVQRTKRNIFKIYFRNLINSGARQSYVPNPTSWDDLKVLGLPCFIESVVYEPDMEAGFFESTRDTVLDLPSLDEPLSMEEQTRYAKNIKLSLKMEVDTEFGMDAADRYGSRAIRSFNSNGTYAVDDNGFFPFLVGVNSTAKGEEHGRGLNRTTQPYVTLDDMNSTSVLSYSDGGIVVFISIPVMEDKGDSSLDTKAFETHKRKRWVRFEGYIENFSREVSNQVTILKNDRAPVYQKSRDTTWKPMKYKLSFNIPSRSIEEAIKNCGKIQYLIKMFYKLNKCPNDNLSDQIRNVLRVCVPTFIEGEASYLRGSSRWTPLGYGASFDNLYYNSASLIPDTLDLTIDSSMGFFNFGESVEQLLFDGKPVTDSTDLMNGMLFPKVMSLSLEFTDGEFTNMPPLYLEPFKIPASYQFVHGPTDLTAIGVDQTYGSYPSNKGYTNISEPNDAPQYYPFEEKHIKLGETK